MNPIQKFLFDKLSKSNRKEKYFADKFGITLTEFNKIKNGRNMPSTILFCRICVELNLGTTQIFELVSDLSEFHRNRVIKPRGINSKKEG